MPSFKCTIYCLIFVCAISTAAMSHIPKHGLVPPRTERIKINTKEAFGEEIIGFPFEVVNESWLKLSDRWEAKLLVAREHFTRDNLIRLSHWYSKRHPIWSQGIHLNIYTSAGRLLEPELPCRLGANLRGSTAAATRPTIDAVFTREGQDGHLSGNYNESLFLTPHGIGSAEGSTIVLSGTIWARSKRNVEQREFEAGCVKVRFTVYELPDVRPDGFYHTLEAFSVNGGYWYPIDTIISKVRLNASDVNVKCVDGKVSIVSMGWLCAISNDSGEHWNAWNAARETHNIDCCSPHLVDKIVVDREGLGSMRLSPVNNAFGTQLLLTDDYGAHWRKRGGKRSY